MNSHYHNFNMTDVNDQCLQTLAFPYMQRRSDITANAPATCKWIYEHPDYRDWVRSGGLLWIRGRPGSGKSTLMDSILSTTQEGSIESTLVASFFFHRRGDPLQHSILGLFRSLLHQILSHDSKLLSDFVQITQFEKRPTQHGAQGLKWDWTESELRDQLAGFVPRFIKEKKLCLHIDALDEAGEDTATDLLNYLRKLCPSASARFHVCVSCRPWPNIFSKRHWDFRITVEDENASDIEKFLNSELKPYMSSTDDSDWIEVNQQVATRALGVFQWVVLVTRKVISRRDHENFGKNFILDIIKETPKELSDVYQSMFDHLQDPSKQQDRMWALRILRWLTFAARPLSLAELRYAVAFDEDEEDKHFRTIRDCEASAHWCADDETMEKRVLRLSSGLARTVVIDETASERLLIDSLIQKYLGRGSLDDAGPRQPEFDVLNDGNHRSNDLSRVTLQFDHESVQDYMTTRGISFLETFSRAGSDLGLLGRAHYRLMMSCLRYIQAFDEETLRPFSKLPFTRYATRYCKDHMKAAENHGASLRNVMGFTKWPSYMVWNLLDSTKTSRDFDRSGRPTTLQHYACEHGLYSLMEAISRFCKGKGRLYAHSDMPRWMQRRWRPNFGCDNINVADGAGRTPLSIAAKRGDQKMVKLLLDTRKVAVDFDFKNLGSNSALLDAVESGSEATVKLLLETGQFRVDQRSEALSSAATHGHESVVKLLLGTRNVKMFKDSLASAARRGHWGAVKLLFNADETGYQPSLAFEAAKQHQNTLLQLFLDKSGPRLGNPLAGAAAGGNVEIVRMLIDRGATVNDETGYSGPTALQESAANGHFEVVKLLLAANADVNAAPCGFYGSTALQAAVEGGHLEVLNLLLTAGANINGVSWSIRGGRNTTALQFAVLHGHHTIVNTLVGKGADINTKDRLSRIALHHAARLGNPLITQALVLAGSHLSARDRQGLTPLQAAQRELQKSKDRLMHYKSGQVASETMLRDWEHRFRRLTEVIEILTREAPTSAAP